jgi:transcriptional regulator with XRE-family HTH domain
MPTAGDRIREIREKRGINQDKLAEEADLSKSFLSEVENNKRNISSQALLRIAKILGASVDYLLTGEAKENKLTDPVVIPPELSRAAAELHLSFSDTIELLEAHRSVVARRSTKSTKNFTSEDWKELYKAIKKVFG